MANLPSELALLFLLLLGNGLFAMAEIALVASRKSRLQRLAEAGDARAQQALAAANEPARLLVTMRAAITLIGVLAGALVGATLADDLAVVLGRVAGLGPYAQGISYVLVVTGITLSSVVIGELIPRRLALHYPERLAMALAGPMGAVVRFVSPVVRLLTLLTNLLLKPFGLARAPKAAAVTDEEVNILIEQGMSTGVFNKADRQMVAGVLALDRLPVTAVMTPRPKIVFLNLEDPEETNWRKIVAGGHSRFPIFQGTRDQIVGIVTVKAIWANSAFGLTTHLKNLMVPPVIVPETMTAIQLLEQFKKSGLHIALVADEFGAIQGLVTLIDVLEAVVGDLPERGRRTTPEARQREDGSWLIDATLAAAELKKMLRLRSLPNEEQAGFQTLGGFVMTQFGRIPRAGEFFDYDGWRFEVTDMDRQRIDKVLVGPVPPPAAAHQAAS